MDKSGRKALAANIKAITDSSPSRRGWAVARKLDPKMVERAEKDEGEKGVSLQTVDDIAKGLGLRPWQLLVPGLDIKHPPGLTTEERPSPLTIGALVRDLATAAAPMSERERVALADGVARMLRLGPDAREAAALDALTPGLRLNQSLRFDLDQAVSDPQPDDQGAPQLLGGEQSSGAQKWDKKLLPAKASTGRTRGTRKSTGSR